jgi:hypothetical protein
MKYRRALLLLAVLASSWLLPACAAFVQSDKQAIRVSSAPVSAAVFVNGKPKGSAPTVVWLARSKRGQVVRFESPGYNPVEVRIVRRLNVLPYVLDAGLGLALSALYEEAAFLQNEIRSSTWAISLPICIGIPVVIDLASGKANTLSPRTLSVTLTKAEGPPRVETIVVEAEDLQEIERIRVNKD